MFCLPRANTVDSYSILGVCRSVLKKLSHCVKLLVGGWHAPLVTPTTPCLLAIYGVMFSPAIKPAIEAVFTITPLIWLWSLMDILALPLPAQLEQGFVTRRQLALE